MEEWPITALRYSSFCEDSFDVEIIDRVNDDGGKIVNKRKRKMENRKWIGKGQEAQRCFKPKRRRRRRRRKSKSFLKRFFWSRQPWNDDVATSSVAISTQTFNYKTFSREFVFGTWTVWLIGHFPHERRNRQCIIQRRRLIYFLIFDINIYSNWYWRYRHQFCWCHLNISTTDSRNETKFLDIGNWQAWASLNVINWSANIGYYSNWTFFFW